MPERTGPDANGTDPNAAHASLSAEDRRLVADATEILATAWNEASPFDAVLRAHERLLPGSVPLLYTWKEQPEKRPELLAGDPAAVELFERARELVPRLQTYSVDQPDEWANRAVATETLFAARPDWRERLADGFLGYLALRDQLRAVLFDGDQFLAWSGALRPIDGAPFTSRDEALLDALVPAIREHVIFARALGQQALVAGELSQLLDAMPNPAFVLSPGATLIFANRCARAMYDRIPSFLRACVEGVVPNGVHARRVQLEQRSVFVVFVDATGAERRSEGSAVLAGLSPRLACVAELLAQGLSEKQVADRMGLTLSSTRTYVHRLYERLGVHNRVELMRALRASL